MTLQEQIDFVTGPQLPIGASWFDQAQISMAKMLGQMCPAIPPTDPTLLNEYALHLQYYDLAKSEYTVYRRTNDPIFLDHARNAADSWWQHPWIKSGTYRPWPDNASPPPRHAGIGGLILRALDGKPEYWDFCVAYTQTFLNIYLLWRLSNAKLHVDIREGAFTFHYAAWLAHVLPDSFPRQGGGTWTNGAEIRAKLHADLNNIVINYYQRLQYPCGCWRYDGESRDADGGTLVGITQPFTIGLLLLAFADFHQITTNAAVRESLKIMILKAAKHLYVDGLYRKDDPIPYDPSKRWRCFWYLFHGGTTVNPTKFEQGGWSLPGTTKSDVQDGRQSIGPVIGIYGYAFRISGDLFYLEAGKELWDSAYGDTDGIRNYMNTDGKGFNQNCARAGSYLAWTGTAPSTPTPTPTPEPTPTKPPSPDGTKAKTIVDSTGGTWTLGLELQTLRDGVHLGRGAGSIYKYLSGVVYVLGTDASWYRWTGTLWSTVGPLEPGVTIPPPPPPDPIPQPVPTVPAPLRSVTWPKQVSKQNPIIQAQRRDGYYLTGIIEGISTKAEFEKVNP